jgi:hypothetical protein
LIASLVLPDVFAAAGRPETFAANVGRFFEDFGPVQASSLDAIVASALSRALVAGADSPLRCLSDHETTALVDAFALCAIVHKPLSMRLGKAIDARLAPVEPPRFGSVHARVAEVDALRAGFADVVAALSAKSENPPPAKPGIGARAFGQLALVVAALVFGAVLLVLFRA